MVAWAQGADGTNPLDTKILVPFIRVLGGRHPLFPPDNTKPGGYTPAQVKAAYGLSDDTEGGLGQTIALIEEYGSPTVQRDLDIFCKQFALPATSVQVFHVKGIGGRFYDDGWAAETSLDVQWAHAIAPRANLMVVVIASGSYADVLAGVDFATLHGATQVSMSFGAPEFDGLSDYDSHFGAPGVGFFAAAGDSGTHVQWPAVSPGVTSVGGTNLKLDQAGSFVSEVAWTESGGGVSAFFKEPGYQNGVQNTGYRTMPDVSYNAGAGIPVYDSTSFGSQRGWITVFGTSAGTPQWAAILAVINSHRSSPVQSVNETLYLLGAPSNNSYYYRDIISGCDGPISPLNCAVPGYDFVTGLGSPSIGRLIAAPSTQ